MTIYDWVGPETSPSGDDDLDAVKELDALFPTRYGSGDLVGLGQFILNLTRHPGDPETDAENIAIAVLGALNEKEAGT